MQTAFVYHPVFMEHDTGPRHPETSQRLAALINGLEESGLLEKCLRLEPGTASIESVEMIHSAEHVRHIAEQSGLGRHFFEGLDTVGNSATYRAALTAVGAVQAGIDAVVSGDVKNAFCAVRPPGHHAERSEAMGFCFFNNVAIGVRHLQAVHNIRRIAIIDWDVHHGNGTQHAFDEDPSVFYFSIHQYPHYPGTGRRDECGIGPARGTILNAPVASGSTDIDYLRVFREQLMPALRKFRPEFILISAGFDAHERDPLSGILLRTGAFADMTAMVMAAADEFCDGRLVSVLEGGYDLSALAESVVAHVGALCGEKPE